MTIFYAPDIANSPFLPDDESAHCAKVLRLQAGAVVHLIDGVGNLYEAAIVAPHAKRTEVKILSVQPDFGCRPWRLHLAVAPTKNSDRFEWFVEKATDNAVAVPLFRTQSHSPRPHRENFGVGLETVVQSAHPATQPDDGGGRLPATSARTVSLCGTLLRRR